MSAPYPRSDLYVLDGHEPRAVEDHDEWMRFYEDFNKRRVDYTELSDDVAVSTVFLAINHNFSSEGPPILFETVVQGGAIDGYMERYPTWDEAQAGHDSTVQQLRVLQAYQNQPE